MQAQQYWNEIGSKKIFEDPLCLEKLSPFLSKEDRIVEYGCGYGRMLKMLKDAGYENLVGFDFAPNMIGRGKEENPDLDLRLLDQNGVIPQKNESADAIVMSTVLCCITKDQELHSLIKEISRVLKKGAVLYMTDFLVCSHERYQERYQKGQEQFGAWGYLYHC